MSYARPAVVSRRRFLATTGVAVATLGAPGLARAQKKEIVVGGAASHKAFMEPNILPLFEKKYDCKVIFEGTKSLVNLEKMVSNRDKPYLSVVMMDDPVMIQAVDEKVIDKITPKDVPNVSKLRPAAVHMDGMWANYQFPWAGVAYNAQKKSGGVASWTELWEGKNKGRVIVPSLQNTEGLSVLFLAAHLETGKPLKEAQYQADAAFKKLKALKANLLTIYTQMPQAFNLLEQGEALMIGGALSSYALQRKTQGAPVDLSTPKEMGMTMPSGIAKVKGGPQPALAHAFINEMLGPEYQALLSKVAFAIPTHTGVAAAPGIPDSSKVFTPDWANVTKHRKAWVERWDKEMAV
jgi:putative spermidine/putrescine transport system substrate-binding protein